MRKRPRRVAKSIFDPIHGVITVEGAALELIGLPVFQRLWGIRQTGLAHLVFPGANHTRLEHSLGVYAVARAMGERLDLPTADRQLIAVGGLLHDLGHPPFSHTLEPTMREVLGAGHEHRSRLRIEGTVVASPADDDIRTRTVPDVLAAHGISASAVADLIDPAGARRPPAPLLSAILHGAIDADRIDYLQRDAHYTGVGHGAIDAVRLMDTVRVANGRLVFAEKGRTAVEGFLVGRALMYASVYYHKTVRAAELMAQGAVERSPGYPESAVPLLDATDGDLIAALRRATGPSGRLIRALLDRRLLKRAHAWERLTPALRRGFRRLARVPTERRALEDELARAVGGPPGSVLFDLAGLDPRDSPEADWAKVGILEGERVTHPFRAPSLWLSLAARPPTRAAVSVYAEPRVRAAVRARLARGGLPFA